MIDARTPGILAVAEEADHQLLEPPQVWAGAACGAAGASALQSEVSVCALQSSVTWYPLGALIAGAAAAAGAGAPSAFQSVTPSSPPQSSLVGAALKSPVFIIWASAVSALSFSSFSASSGSR